MKIAYRIQHGQGTRDHWLKLLLLMLDSKKVEVHTDKTHSLWQSCSDTLTSYRKGDTHVLVLQDDVLPCKNFIKTVSEIAESCPENPVTFFTNNQKSVTAVQQGKHWLSMRVWFMAQAYLLPVALIDDMILWISQNVKDSIQNDDDRMATYLFYHDIFTMATVPSLVEHMGWNTTTLRNYNNFNDLKNRRDLRMASVWIGLDSDPMDIDWSVRESNILIDKEGNNSQFCSNLK